MELSISSPSIPESDLRGASQRLGHQPPFFENPPGVSQQAFHFGEAPSSFGAYPDHLRQPQDTGHHYPPTSDSFHTLDFNAGALHGQMHNDFLPPMHESNLIDSDFHNLVGNHNFDQQPIDFPPCHDCTSTSITTIPHHHHKTGRLAGASAQLDGHFCCSWLVHDQPCFLCFSSAEALDNHIKSDHAGKDGTYRCLWQDCSKFDKSSNTIQPVNFGNKPKLMRHVHSHTGYKPFPCPYPGCDKGFVTKEQLKNHETTHTKSRKYQCDQCGKTFAVKSALTTHITAVHEERKIHKCDMCGKAFADSSNLSKHKQTHFKSNGVTKRRAPKRETSDGTSTPTTPSIPTPTYTPATPVAPEIHGRIPPLPTYNSANDMLPPSAMVKLPTATSFFSDGRPSISAGRISFSNTSTTSSPHPENFDANCYCCEQNCPEPEYCCDDDCAAPEGPPKPCDAQESCDCATFCDLPGCLSPPPGGGDAVITSVDTSNTTTAESSPALLSSSMPLHDPYLSASQVQALRQFQLPANWDDFIESPSMH